MQDTPHPHTSDDRSQTSRARLPPSLLRSVMGRRVLGQYVAVAMLPIAALALLDALHVPDSHLKVAALAATLGLVLGAWQTRRIVDRLRRLLAGTRRIMAHDFSCEIPSEGRDEIAQLSRAFNEMARSLGMNFATLNVLSQIDQTILSRRDIAEVAKSALRCVRYITSAQVVVLGLFENEKAESMRIYVLRQDRHPKIRARFELTPELKQLIPDSAPTAWIAQPPLP
jgi:HAMP domain-containing protein